MRQVLLALLQVASPHTVALPAPRATLSFEFTAVSAVRELPDGRLLIVDRSEKKVYAATWATGTVTPIGGNGSGPGEYLQPVSLLAVSPDTTLLPDLRNGRWLLLHGATIVGTVGSDAPVLVNGGRSPVGADEQGRVLLTRAIVGPGSATLPAGDSALLVRLVRSTGRGDTIARLRERPRRINIQGPAANPTAVSIAVNPLSAGEQAVLYPDGWIAIARLEPYRVEWRSPDGRKVSGRPLPFRPTRLDARERLAFLEREAERTGRPPRDAATIADWPETVPPFLTGALLPAPNGLLWIRRAPTAALPNPPYDVIDRAGVLVARVDCGANVEVIGFGNGMVYSVLTDDSGLQHLQRSPLPKV